MDLLDQMIGSSSDEITWWQMACRSVLVFLYTLLLLRLGGRRIFGKFTSFDIVLGIILGSIMSRTLTGNSEFFPTLIAATTLVGLHWLLAALAARNRLIARAIKGTEILIVENGNLCWSAMNKNQLTERDVSEAVRIKGGVADISQVKAAYLECGGDVSVVKQ
jgi:uncharacterized membrane protein YcaP (DUF421 family)